MPLCGMLSSTYLLRRVAKSIIYSQFQPILRPNAHGDRSTTPHNDRIWSAALQTSGACVNVTIITRGSWFSYS